MKHLVVLSGQSPEYARWVGQGALDCGRESHFCPSVSLVYAAWVVARVHRSALHLRIGRPIYKSLDQPLQFLGEVELVVATDKPTRARCSTSNCEKYPEQNLLD